MVCEDHYIYTQPFLVEHPPQQASAFELFKIKMYDSSMYLHLFAQTQMYSNVFNIVFLIYIYF